MRSADLLRASLAGLALACGVACAQAPGSQGSPTAPASGTLVPAMPSASTPARNWTTAQARQAFASADQDGDGRLNRSEAQRLPVMPRSFEDADTNKDGVLDLDEYLASFPH